MRFKGVSGTSKLKLKQFKRQSKLKQLMPHMCFKKTKPRTHILVFFSKGNSVRRVGVVQDSIPNRKESYDTFQAGPTVLDPLHPFLIVSFAAATTASKLGTLAELLEDGAPDSGTVGMEGPEAGRGIAFTAGGGGGRTNERSVPVCPRPRWGC